MIGRIWGSAAVLVWLVAGVGLGGRARESEVKRQEAFEFTQKPSVKRDGDRVTITFTSRAFCDATVAVEDSQGRIVRHLASGVLGSNAPEPFQRDSLKQAVVWDGKNDKGEQVDDKASLKIRVSLGLKPRLERTLYWSPKKRASQDVRKGVAIRAAPEGVYVYDGGQAVDHIRLFGHQGEYVRTVYPFPAEQIANVKGLIRHRFPQDGRTLPIKPSYQMCTLLTSGDNALNLIFQDGRYVVGPMDPSHKGEYGRAATDIAVAGGRMAVGAVRLNRLATDGTSGGLPVYGPYVCLQNQRGFYKATDSALSLKLGGYELLTHLRPHRFAFSPDGKTLYMTRFMENFSLDYVWNYWQHAVYRMDYEDDKEPVLFLGAPERGSDASHFNMPTDVACDGEGRVYVADCGNHRVQVFYPDGRLFTSIPVEAPAQVAVSPKGELYVFSWEMLPNRNERRLEVARPYTLRKFRSAADPQLVATYELPMAETRGKYGQVAEIDFWTEPLTVWLSPGQRLAAGGSRDVRGGGSGIVVLVEKDNRLEPLRDFEQEVRQAAIVTLAPGNNRQRLYCDPARGLLYVGEGGFHFQQAIVADPVTGRLQLVQLPFDAEDMCFDSDGLAYLRTANLVARYEPAADWREVPWDYGEQREKVTYNSHSGRREAKVVSGVALPVNSGWHHGGLHVSPKGNLAVGCLNLYGPEERVPRGQTPIAVAKPYTPRLYPGRIIDAAYGCEYVHVWDRHGRLLYEDAIPGLGTLNGVAIDNQDNLYVLSAANRALDGSPPFNFLAGTLMKFPPGKAKIVSDDPKAPIPLRPENRPERPADLVRLPGDAWAEGAEWFLGGVGWHGKNHGLGCGCRNTRFALDYFGRAFAPEMDRYSVAVLDSSGNVILRVGTYGNVDDGMPLVPAGGPPAPRSIGGDEVALMHAAYLATHTDRRLFIADIGNYRILSVKLGYHAEERVSLKDVEGERR